MSRLVFGLHDMRRKASFWFKLPGYLLLALLLVEVASFSIVTLSNYFIYGQLREGSSVRYDPYALYLNREGVRPTHFNFSQPAPGNHKTIWLLGGSTMKGVTDHDDRTIPSYLARFLNQEEPAVPAVLYNFGVPGFNSLLEAKYLQKLLIEADAYPDLIIFYDGANDCAYFTQHRTSYAHHGYRRLQALVESYYHSFFGLLKPLNAALHASYTRELYDKAIQGLVHLDPAAPELQDFARQVVQRYDHVQRLANAHGADFLLFWQPAWWMETEPVSLQIRAVEHRTMIMGQNSALKQNYALLYDILFPRLRDKPYFVNFRNILASRSEPLYQSDGIHLTDAGRHLVAAHLAHYLKENAWGPIFSGHKIPPRRSAAPGKQG
jgi:lysophospholipase L1-like esterase